MRILSLEGKHDTTLEIINNIVGELQYIKKMGNNDSSIKNVNMTVDPIYEVNGGNGYIEVDNKVFVSEGEESDDESIDESYDEGSPDESSEEESDDDGLDEDSDDESDCEDSVKDIKIIKLNSEVEVPTTDVVITKEGHNKGTEPDGSSEPDMIINDHTILDIDVQITSEIPEFNDIDTILDIDVQITPEFPNDIDFSNENVDDTALDSNVDDYRKLNVQSLKSIAISKGLSADPSKLKKKELLHLLA
jgi:hypothetical protein